MMNTNTEYFDCCDLFKLPINERIRYYQNELKKITPPKGFRDQVLANVYRCLLAQYTNQLPLETLIKDQQLSSSNATVHYLNARPRSINERATTKAYQVVQLNQNQKTH